MCMHHILFSRTCMLEKDARQLCAQITGRSDGETYARLISHIGADLAHLKMQVKTFTHFNTRDKYVGLLNTVEDGAAKSSTPYSYTQLQFFYHVVEAIAMDDSAVNGAASMSSIAALNLDTSGPSQLSQLPAGTQGSTKMSSASHRQETLKRLVHDQWLMEIDGRYAIGPRTFLELKEHLLAMQLPEETSRAWNQAL